MSPADQIRNAWNLWGFVMYLREAAERGALTPTLFVQDLKFFIDDAPVPFVGFRQAYDAAAIDDVTFNLQHGALGLLAISVDTALDDHFGSKGTLHSPDVDGVREYFYLLRCAFAHDPLEPRWAIKERYAKVVCIPSLLLSLDFSGLDGRQLRGADFGGHDGLIKLVQFARQLVQDRQSSNNDSLASFRRKQESFGPQVGDFVTARSPGRELKGTVVARDGAFAWGRATRAVCGSSTTMSRRTCALPRSFGPTSWMSTLKGSSSSMPRVVLRAARPRRALTLRGPAVKLLERRGSRAWILTLRRRCDRRCARNVPKRPAPARPWAGSRLSIQSSNGRNARLLIGRRSNALPNSGLQQTPPSRSLGRRS
jgi:hypothetical protein